MEKLYSCTEVAEHYGVAVDTVWTWIKEKKLTAVKVGRAYRIYETDLKAFEKANSTNK